MTTRSTLERIDGNLDESMRARVTSDQPQLSPVPSFKDVSRRPVRDAGRLPVDDIIADPDQPRTHFSQDALERLTRSVRDKGVYSPIRVRWSKEHESWIVVSGERRWRAAKQAGLEFIDCRFIDRDLTRSDILEEQLIENLLREDLGPVEEARAFADLIELNGWTGKQLAETLHIPPSKVTRSLAILRLPADVQELVAAGEIPSRSAYEISRLPDETSKRQLASRIASGNLTHEQASKAVRRHSGKPKRRSSGSKLTFTTEDGWKVTVTNRRKGRYEEVEEALAAALDEVRHRIQNNVVLL